MTINKEKIKNFVKSIDKKTIFISAITSLMILYYINPLNNIELTEWNRTFCTAILSGISISKRINNFYLLFFIQIPIIFLITNLLYGILFKYRKNYKKIFLNLSSILIFPVVISYISKYSTKDALINTNILLQIMLSFFGVLAVTAILDKDNLLKEHIHLLSVSYLVGIVTLNLLLRLQKPLYSIIIMSIIFLIYVIFSVKTKIGKKIFSIAFNYICFLMWIPACIYLIREFFFILNEKGINIMNYYTNILESICLFMIVSFGIVFLLRKKDISFATFGCIGSIVSLSFARYFSNAYQYVYNYGNYNALYELSNSTVASDTILNGKLPIVDYFSAHALNDVFTRILYGLVHSDVKGILVNPYGGLIGMFGLLILFFLLKKFFSKGNALLIVCLFPFSTLGIKAISICFISIVALVNSLKNNKIRTYLVFWVSVLLSAFFIYDEGMSLGIACILAFIIVNVIKREWKNLKKFIVTGMVVGIIVLIFYFIYCSYTEISAISRIKEWISVSLGSSTSWATIYFGDPSTFAFLLSYFIVPICAIVILIIATLQYILKKDDTNTVGIVIAFSIAQLLYISRTIIFHNLEVCSGITGVLLNFIHWTISFFVLYNLNKYSKERQLLIWSATFGLIIIMECILVTNIYPNINDTLYEEAFVNSQKLNLSNDMNSIWGKDRIVYDEPTTKFVNQFKQVFDTLLDEKDTFLDFSDITTLYLLTDRQRPCYVGQSPSLLTDLYSQECFLEEISKYNVPLAVIGTSEYDFIQSMMSVPHNVRYYKIAEYIYENYRPLVLTGDFAIWCKNESYDEFKNVLDQNKFFENGYKSIDYGYDLTKEQKDENGNIQYDYKTYHKYGLEMIPYIWANYDKYGAINNEVMTEIYSNKDNIYEFEGSQIFNNTNGNYLLFECINQKENEEYLNVTFYDSKNNGARFEYGLKIIPGSNKYLIRVSQDYFWKAFDINNITFWNDNNDFIINNVKILKGD